MSIIFNIVKTGHVEPIKQGKVVAYLERDNWDDYGFRTSFNLTVYDEGGKTYNLGHVKIAYKGQTVPPNDVSYTADHLPSSFDNIDGIFSLGQDVEYYSNLLKMPKGIRENLLKAIKDISFNLNILDEISNELVFNDSLLRKISIADIQERFNRVLNGGAALTPFEFGYLKKNNQIESEIDLDFSVTPMSTPPSNIHVLIGRNGAGKTTLLNNMIYSLLRKNEEVYGKFYVKDWNDKKEDLPESYFSSAVLVSFSAFDSFELSTKYTAKKGNEKGDVKELFDFSYIGLKENLNKGSDSHLKNLDALNSEFIAALTECFRFGHTKQLWLKAISRLESDDNFSEMNIQALAQDYITIEDLPHVAGVMFARMSSGHAIVLLTITKLIITVRQKTLVLLDEPESHLHPPLLAAFMHSLSDLLIHRNGLAIIATHSPVVLQEVPQKCAWNIIRYPGGVLTSDRLEIESYGENVGILTREIFGLEVKESGFHKQLFDYVKDDLSYEDILEKHKGKLGLEGRSILKAMTFNRDKRRKG